MNSMNYSIQEKIRKQIEKAFRDDEYPQKEELSRFKYYQGIVCLESQYVEEFLHCLDWRDLTLNSLVDSYKGDFTALHNFLTDKALRYYLPAFLVIILESYEECDLLADNIISVLANGREPSHGIENPLNFLSLDDVKIEATLDFLNYINESHGQDFEEEINLAITNLQNLKTDKKEGRSNVS